jgi:excisionase family DNA binding protein
MPDPDVEQMYSERAEPDYRTVAEIAALFSVTAETVRNWIASGELPAVNIACGEGHGARWRVDLADARKMMHARRRRAV